MKTRAAIVEKQGGDVTARRRPDNGWGADEQILPHTTPGRLKAVPTGRQASATVVSDEQIYTVGWN